MLRRLAKNKNVPQVIVGRLILLRSGLSLHGRESTLVRLSAQQRRKTQQSPTDKRTDWRRDKPRAADEDRQRSRMSEHETDRRRKGADCEASKERTISASSSAILAWMSDMMKAGPRCSSKWHNSRFFGAATRRAACCCGLWLGFSLYYFTPYVEKRYVS